VSEGRRPPAPGALRLVQALVNTIDVESGTDEVTTPSGLQRWMVDRELLSGPATVTAADVTAVVELRESLRLLLLANNGDAVEPADEAAARRVLDGVAAAGGVQVRFEREATVRFEVTADGVAGAMARIVVLVVAAMGDGTWPRLKACRDDTCRWAFFDQSKNHSGAWCDMRVCGSRNKMRTYRSRKRAAPD
jgi:predicted RNA-binding Zn ribbon-like protein